MNDNPRTLDAATVAHLQSWTGRSETAEDDITAAPLRGLAATLDRDDPAPASGKPVPPLAHWLYFLPRARQSELGPDGHARRGGFLPPVPLPRRMWAGGRLTWRPENPLRVGDAAQRVSRIASVTHKAGRSGDLVFVSVRHEVRNGRGPCLAEEHDIVYRAAPVAGQPPAAPTAAGSAGAWQRTLVPDDVLLFRYSALTFNGHRIHYDRRYVTEVEGYPGLVVHGPLIATLLLDLVRREQPGAVVTAFDYRFLRPSFDGRPLHLHARPGPGAEGLGAASEPPGAHVHLWASDHDGWLTVQGTARIG